MGRGVNLVRSIAVTIDDLVDAIVGGRPATRVLDALETIAPANVVRRFGVKPPGDLVDEAVVKAIASARAAGGGPKPGANTLTRRVLRRR